MFNGTILINMKEVRKIVKNGRNSYYVNIPKDFIRQLKWQERQKLTVRRSGKKIIVEDWSR